MAYGSLPGSLLIHSVTIKRDTRGYVSGTLQPKITQANVATGVRSRIEPLAGNILNSVIGRIPEASDRLFCQGDVDLKQNDIVVDEATGGKTYRVREVSNYFDHHLEAIMEVKQV